MTNESEQYPPKISIITPSLNQGAYIEQNIKSIIDQKCPWVEHIILDGGSSDETLSILKRYENQIIWRSEKDSGQVYALNNGLKMATGDIITFLNSDDYYLPGSLIHISELFKNAEIQWVTGDCVVVNSKNEQIHKSISLFKSLLRRLKIRQIHLLFNCFIQPSTFWRRSLQMEAGYFDKQFDYAFDYDYWIRLYKISQPYITEKKLSAFRIHPQSKGSMSFIKQFDEEISILKKNHANIFIIFLHKILNLLIKIIYKYIK